MKLLRRSIDVKVQDAAIDALLVAGRAALESAELEKALETILSGAIGLVGGDQGSVQLLDPATMTLSVAAFRGLDPEARRQRVAMGQGISGTVAVTGQPLLLASASDVERFGGPVQRRRRIAAALSVPLRTREATIGVLNVNATRTGAAFSEHHLRLVTLFAETAALAITNSRLLTETRRHAAELELLRGSTLRLASSLDLGTVAEAALHEVLSIASSDAGFLCLVAEENGDLELAPYAGISRDGLRSVLGSPTFRRAHMAADVTVVPDVSVDPVLKALTVDLWGRALALLPLRTPDGREGGLLGVALTQPATPELRRLLATFAGQAALALSNAMLHRRVSSKEQELDTIVTALDLPILLLDEHRRFRAINPAAAATFRLSPDFEIGHTARGKLPQEIEALALDRWDDVSAEVEIARGAERRSFRLTAATVRRGRRAGARVVVFADVSSERELERHKADFLAVVGHELRTPLTSIKGYAHTLARYEGELKPDLRRQAVGTIVAQSERLERLIEDLLFVSRIEHGRPPLHLAWEDLVEVCAGIVGEVGRRFPGRMIRFDRPEEGIPTYTDRVKVEQMLAHMLDNAIKYSGEDRPVQVRVEAGNVSLSISVRDEGAGIYSGDVERIFQPFTQLDPSSTRRAGGTGMGLYICSTLAESLGGALEVDTALGKGSTFTLMLPREITPPPVEPDADQP